MKKRMTRVITGVLTAIIVVGSLSSTTYSYAAKSPTRAPKPVVQSEVNAKSQDGLIPTVSTKKDGTASITKIAKTNQTEIKVLSMVVVNGISYTVTGISSKAFADCKEMKTVELPDTITEIGEKAFSGAKKLKKIELTSLVAPKISKKAFKGLETKKITITYDPQMSKGEVKKLKKALKKAEFEGKLKKSTKKQDTGNNP